MEVIDIIERFGVLALAAAYVAGIVLALVFWSRHPKQSLCLLIAAGLLLGIELIYIGIWFVSEDQLDDDFYAGLGTLSSVVHIMAFALFVTAIFSGRAGKQTTFFDDDHG